MTRAQATAGTLAALLLCGCFNFDQRLADCRSDAGWRCGDAGAGDGGGSSDGGDGADAGALPSTAGLFCQQGWCWEHPRPARFDLEAIWGKSRDDFWVGGRGGVLAHWDGTRWSSAGQSLEREVRVRSICAHDDDVYFGMGWFASGNSTKQLLRYRDGGWLDLSANVSEVRQVSCGERLLVAHWGGVSAMEWTEGTLASVYAAGSTEICDSVVDLGGGDCLFACHDDSSVPAPRIRRCDGTLELSRATGAEADSVFDVLWSDPHRGPLTATWGTREVLQRDGGWQPIWTGNVPRSVTAAVSFDGGSIGVGPYGTILEFTRTGIAETQFQALGNGYLLGVWVPPSGQPIAVGEWGCIIERTPQGWVRRNDCDLEVTDVSFGPELLALTARAVLVRDATGWRVKEPLTEERRGLRQLGDGGLVMLTDTTLSLGRSLISLGVTDARTFELVNDGRALVTTESGALLEVPLPFGMKRTALASGVVGRPVVDEQGAAWVRLGDGSVRVSRGGGAWEPEAVSDAGALDDLAVGNGRVWALQGSRVFWRSTTAPGWTERPALRAFTRIVPLAGDRALLLRDDVDAVVMDTAGLSTPTAPSPTPLVGPTFSRGGEAWGVGFAGGLVRFREP